MKITNLPECDNISRCHDMVEIAENENALRVYCKECKNQYVVWKDQRGLPDNQQWQKLYKRFVLQGTNLFYKYYPKWLST